MALVGYCLFLNTNCTLDKGMTPNLKTSGAYKLNF